MRPPATSDPAATEPDTGPHDGGPANDGPTKGRRSDPRGTAAQAADRERHHEPERERRHEDERHHERDSDRATSHRARANAAQAGTTRNLRFGGPLARLASSLPRPQQVIAICALVALVAGSLIASSGLVSCGNQKAVDATISRPVTATEAARLAGVRYANYTDGRVGVHVTIGNGAGAVHLTGWVDWRQQLIYLNSTGVRPGAGDGMIQAIPGVIAVRPGRYTPPSSGTGAANSQYDPYPAPPLAPPPTGWQIRPYTPGSPIDTMVTLLFAMRATAVDDAAQIQSIGTRFAGTDEIKGEPVDIFDGAAIPPAAQPKSTATPKPTASAHRTPATEATPLATPSPVVTESAAGAGAATASPSASRLPFAAQGGQVRYWVNAHSRVLRAAALVNPTTALEIDFDRADHTVPSAIELLGGAPIKPAPVTNDQANLLAHMRLTDRKAGSGSVSLAVPVNADQLLSGLGWLDWQHGAIYLTVRNNKSTGPDATVRADARGLAIHGSLGGSSHAADTSRDQITVPTLPPPTTGWTDASWVSREDAYGSPDLDLMLIEAVTLTSARRDDVAGLKAMSSSLRSDEVNGVPVTVFEIRDVAERSIVPGGGRLRYWVDATGLLRRLEIRTRTGAYGYLTLTPGDVPSIPKVN